MTGDVRSPRVAARRARTKAEILEAAWDLAHRDGLGGIGMRELAGKLGMSASSLYEYFSGKDAIYDAMFIQGNEAMRDSYDTALPPPSDVGVREAFIAGTRAFVEFCNEDIVRFQLLFQRSIPGWEPSEEAYALAVQNLERLRSFLVECGIDDTESLDLWTAISSGLASQQVANDPGGERWIRLIEPAVDMFLATRGTS